MLTINKILKYSLFLKKRDHECSEKKAIRIKKYQVFTLLKQILRIFFKKKKKKRNPSKSNENVSFNFPSILPFSPIEKDIQNNRLNVPPCTSTAPRYRTLSAHENEFSVPIAERAWLLLAYKRKV